MTIQKFMDITTGRQMSISKRMGHVVTYDGRACSLCEVDTWGQFGDMVDMSSEGHLVEFGVSHLSDHVSVPNLRCGLFLRRGESYLDMTTLVEGYTESDMVSYVSGFVQDEFEGDFFGATKEEYEIVAMAYIDNEHGSNKYFFDIDPINVKLNYRDIYDLVQLYVGINLTINISELDRVKGELTTL